MNPLSCASRRFAAIAVLTAGLTGCTNFFVTKHKVLVDAISSPEALKPSGQSYRLVAKRSIANSVPVQVSVVKACIDAALGSAGMFEAPPNAPPDLVIEVGFGQDSTPRVDPAARETYLQLSARANPKGAIDKPTGEELWDVRVAVLGIAGRIETAMPLLCSVAATYVATNTKVETRIEIPQNSPLVAAVRENAIKALDAKNAPVTPPAGESGSPVPNSVTVGPNAGVIGAPPPGSK
jgi:hypothetical protein